MHKSTRGLLISLLYYQREFASFVLNANTFICTFEEVHVGDSTLEAVDRFCYLGDMLSAGGGCMAAATARCRSA